MRRERDQQEDDIDRLMDWAEEEEKEMAELPHLEENEPCDSDIADDAAGLPSGTVGSYEESADEEISEEIGQAD